MSTVCDDQQTAVMPLRPSTVRAVSDLVAGQIVASRYRIIDCLGSGGMGEVYRADDLKLGQRIALKRLNVQLRKPFYRNLLYQEIRAGREFAHPNLCRIHDLVETESDCFVSMEYIDGEDLSALIRRIGRLPHRKGLEIARDLISALAGIHRRGMLHRDIKPSNVIIDREGRSRLTDFGLSVTAKDPAISDRSGSPHYMAPEVLAGSPATPRSDIYALGVTLYEIFTGSRVHSGATLREIRDSQLREVKPPSHICPNMDPALERTILWCIERDPQNRPADATVLQEVLPLPDVTVNEVRHTERSGPEVALSAASANVATATFAVALVALLAVAWLYGRTGLQARLAGSHTSQRLVDGTRENLGILGFPGGGESAAFWASVTGAAEGPYLVYRQGPRGATASNEWARWLLNDPQQPGTATVAVDGYGTLKALSVVPGPEHLGRRAMISPLFEWAGLDSDEWVPAEPSQLPPVPHDQRMAWVSLRNAALRVEAASVVGIPVYFEVIDSAAGPALERLEIVREPDLGFPPLLYMVVMTIGMTVACFAARHNVVRGRGDRRAAFRIASYIFAVTLFAWIALANHVPAFETEWRLLMRGIAVALLHAAAIWLLYLAIEPYMRRQWPHMTIAWTRLLGGRLFDRSVGRDTLVGMLAGLAGRIVLMLDEIPWIGGSAATPHSSSLLALGSGKDALFVLFYYQFVAVFFALGLVLLLIVLRRFSSNDVIALAVLTAVVSPMGVSGANVPFELTLSAVRNGLMIAVLYRYGIHALAVAWLTYYVTLRIPLTLDLSAWYSGRSLLAIALIASIAILSYRAWIGQQSFIGRILSEPQPRAGT